MELRLSIITLGVVVRATAFYERLGFVRGASSNAHISFFHAGGMVLAVFGRQMQTANGRLALRREKQAMAWMWERIDHGLKLAFRHHPAVRDMLPQVQSDVAAGKLAASTAARNLLLAHVGQAQAATNL